MRVIKKPLVKRTTTKTSSSTTKPSSSSSSSSSNSSNTNTSYNDILNKLNDYVLKSSIANFVTNETLASAISNIKQCNCEQSTLPTNTDNNVLNELIRKLNNYGIFQYDVAGKETIVTEFFPHLTQNSTGSYSNGIIQYRPSGDLPMYLIAYNVDLFDYLLIKEDNNTPINQSSYKNYFTKSVDYSHYCYVSSAIVNEHIIKNSESSNIKYLTLILDGDGIINALSSAGYNPKDPAEAQELVNLTGPKTLIVEFIPATNFTKNGITCEFNGNYGGTGHYIAGGTIKLTLPENISLVNNLPNGSYTISANGNIITIKLSEEDANGNIIQYYGVFTKQIIIAESSTKRYVIKLNGEPQSLPPGY